MNNYDNIADYNTNMRGETLYLDTKLLIIYFSQYLANFFEKKY